MPALTEINERPAKPRMLRVNGGTLMSWRRGLLRPWLVASAAWLIGWTLFIATWTPLQLYLLGLTVPMAVLVVGWVIVAFGWFWGRRGLP